MFQAGKASRRASLLYCSGIPKQASHSDPHKQQGRRQLSLVSKSHHWKNLFHYQPLSTLFSLQLDSDYWWCFWKPNYCRWVRSFLGFFFFFFWPFKARFSQHSAVFLRICSAWEASFMLRPKKPKMPMFELMCLARGPEMIVPKLALPLLPPHFPSYACWWGFKGWQTEHYMPIRFVRKRRDFFPL